MSEEKKENTLEHFQKSIQQSTLRRTFSFTQLTSEELKDYTAFLIGNDRPLTEEEVELFQMETNFVLVGTSVFRSIDFACKLSAKYNVTPKVFIIDNSRQVHETWEKLKNFFAESTETDIKSFLHGKTGLFEFILNELLDVTHGMNPVRYFSEFFRSFNIEYVKNIVLATEVLRQDWANSNTFRDIRNLYSDRPIVAYPSNIISCCEETDQCRVLQSIESLKPSVCIFSNLDPIQRIPTKTHILPEPTALGIIEKLGLEIRLIEDSKEEDENIFGRGY
ncbi:hypothetical protein [Legionella israelensis]|uniref:Uncharacterized protein n=1 Tax=Legionella israelensis TaxID=454 RepID=A0A0W0WNI6_9GAMM|nr:hypothetical protein [Legionella israelensis]KTD33879.1 hypothetical protein Lisr_0247 [Legionella israelensis]QBS08954.1 hypothetical protein E4T55_03210 [Legionella israelensis]SCX81775.1 hypothetical protein SAMN02746069_00317 [Legionella israelensis DSM 19235]STX58646.1 Uncharacterised protein [Legionella israelensis]